MIFTETNLERFRERWALHLNSDTDMFIGTMLDDWPAHVELRIWHSYCVVGADRAVWAWRWEVSTRDWDCKPLMMSDQGRTREFTDSSEGEKILKSTLAEIYNKAEEFALRHFPIKPPWDEKKILRWAYLQKAHLELAARQREWDYYYGDSAVPKKTDDSLPIFLM